MPAPAAMQPALADLFVSGGLFTFADGSSPPPEQHRTANEESGQVDNTATRSRVCVQRPTYS
jgi:hypothetical protein